MIIKYLLADEIKHMRKTVKSKLNCSKGVADGIIASYLNDKRLNFQLKVNTIK